MASILKSIKPYYFYLITEGIKKVDIFKTLPDLKEWDGTVYLYCTKNMGSFKRIPQDKQDKYKKYLGTVGAQFIGDKTSACIYLTLVCPKPKLPHNLVVDTIEHNVDIYPTLEEMYLYNNGKRLYSFNISDVFVYDTPYELSDFRTTAHCFYEKKLSSRKVVSDEYGETYEYGYDYNSKNSLCNYCDKKDDFGSCSLVPHSVYVAPKEWQYVNIN